MFELALSSLRARRLTATLAIITVALSVLMMLGVERLRHDARASFASTVSGTDLIVGARTGSVQLLLYSVFRAGNATNNIGWDSYQALAHDRRVAWTIPVSLGDSHKGYSVLGTNADYFRYLRYADRQPLQLASGAVFARAHDAVLGAEVARKLGYHVGSQIVLTHGMGDAGGSDHADQPFTVTGILAPTGTPIDRTVHVSLAGLEAIHNGWESGSASLLAQSGAYADESGLDATPQSITAFYVGLKSRTSIFSVQRAINRFGGEPLLAIMPGVALAELWELMSLAEQALAVLSWFVVAVGLFGMMTALLTGINERRREMAILRSTGARPATLFALLLGEAALLVAAGIVLGTVLLNAALAALAPLLQSEFGLISGARWPDTREATLLALVFVAGVLVSLVPAWRAYRMSLSDGLSVGG
ncbi:ABC transporter permease [Chitinibacteraceae bacterium HSL-7]